MRRNNMEEINGVRLTERDLEWLRLLARGEVIKRLPGMKSAQAAKNRVQTLRRAFKADNVAQLVAEAMRRGLIQ